MELVLSAFLLSCGLATVGYFLSQMGNRVITLFEQELSHRRTDTKEVRAATSKVTEPLPPVPVELLTLAGKWGSGERPDEWATQDTIKSLQEAYVETGNWEKAAERVGLFT